VEGFFGIYDHLVKPHSLTSESHVTDYHLFREGISPTWEDPKNRNGGKWIVRLRKVEGLASLYWEDLIMALVGEQFGDVGVQVCGVVVSVRQHEDILSVWTQDSKDDDAIAKIRDAIKGNLDLPPFVTIDYKRISASRGAAAPSRHRRDSCPSHDGVGGFFLDFGAVRTEVSDRDAPRRRHAFHGGQGRAWGGRKQQGDRPHHRRQDRGPRQHHREEAPPPPAERDWGALRRK
jgi:translation initiation factor 4E